MTDRSRETFFARIWQSLTLFEWAELRRFAPTFLPFKLSILDSGPTFIMLYSAGMVPALKSGILGDGILGRIHCLCHR